MQFGLESAPVFCFVAVDIGKIFQMDKIDRKILAELQADGRLTVTELAERVGLSVSPCHRRVRALEQSGAIQGYRAQLDPVPLGLAFSAIVFVTLRESDHRAVSTFETAILDVLEVIQAQRLFGDPDYLLRVVTRDLPAFQKLYDERLSKLPGVQRLTSTLVMKSVMATARSRFDAGRPQIPLAPSTCMRWRHPATVAASIFPAAPTNVLRTGAMPTKFRILRSSDFRLWAQKYQR